MNFRKMRKENRELHKERAYELLEKGEYGILSTYSEDIGPYGVPINYVLKDGFIYLHCATQGHKISNIEKNNKVCFTVVGKNELNFEKTFTTLYESVIVFGVAEFVVQEQEKYDALYSLTKKYFSEHESVFDSQIKPALSFVSIIKISIENITAKSNY